MNHENNSQLLEAASQLTILTDENMPQLLKRWEHERIITALDRHFALEISVMHPQTTELLQLLCALLSQHLSGQHTCLNIANLDLNNPMQESQASCRVNLNHQQLEHLLTQFSAVTKIDYQTAKSTTQAAEVATTPLVLAAGRLYLQRYYHYEYEVARLIKNLSLAGPSKLLSASSITNIEADLAITFDHHQLTQSNTNKDSEVDWQKMAVATALTQKFAVITGGPGTGKTTTVTKLLYLLMKHGTPEVRLVAPTGKAAARLSESIKASKQRLAAQFNGNESFGFDFEALTRVPEQAATIHRLLGVVPNSHQFRHHQDNPLRLDVLIVDEASMVDLPMMHKLLSALPPSSQLILLGDQDQLASVEAGAVLADVCQGLKIPHNNENPSILSTTWKMRYSAENAQQLAKLTGYNLSCFVDPQPGLGNSLCMLQKSHRFNDDAGIGQLAAAVNTSDKHGIARVWQHGYQELCWLEHQSAGLENLLKLAITAYGEYLTFLQDKDASSVQIIQTFNKFRVLCAMRAGEFGVEGMNQAIIQALTKAELLQPKQEFYLGRPIIIQSNDYNLELFNGDIGLILNCNDQPNKQQSINQSRLMAHFIKADGSVIQVLPARLPRHETCFAMTVHKSQGSEFESTALVLPLNPSPSQRQLLSKELIYTAITRAKQQFTCLGSTAVFENAAMRATQRSSGLADRLWRGNNL